MIPSHLRTGDSQLDRRLQAQRMLWSVSTGILSVARHTARKPHKDKLLKLVERLRTIEYRFMETAKQEKNSRQIYKQVKARMVATRKQELASPIMVRRSSPPPQTPLEPDSEFLQHEACPECGSPDNLARYSDGHGFCFGCNYFEKGT